MKKLMTALAVSAVAAMSMAESVVSANIVGYSTKQVDLSINNTFTFGVSFVNLSSTDGTYTVDANMFTTPVNINDTLQGFDPVTYNFYAAVRLAGNKWQRFDTSGSPVATPTNWNPTYQLGDCVTLVSASSATTNYIVSGQVSLSNTTTFASDAGGTPFASKIPIDVTGTELKKFMLNGDQIMKFDPILYNFETYLLVNGTFQHYAADGTLTGPVTDNTVILPVGVGGFFVGSGSGGSRVWTQTIGL